MRRPILILALNAVGIRWAHAQGRKKMRGVLTVVALSAALALAACGSDQGPTAPSSASIAQQASAASSQVTGDGTDPAPAAPRPPRSIMVNQPSLPLARAAKLAVCHQTGNGSYRLISISDKGWNGHQRHGDASPGEAVPGMNEYTFDDACVPEPSDPPGCDAVTGDWLGTYSWDCGGDLATGTTDIFFVLTDQCNGRITGTVEYMGGASTVTGWRFSEVTYDPWGIIDGTVAVGGNHVSLRWDASPGNFVNQQFSGEIASGGDTMSGITLNGDTPAFPGTEGCSHGDGAPGSGTFSIFRLGS